LVIDILLIDNNLKEKALARYLITFIFFIHIIFSAESINNFTLNNSESINSFQITFELDEVTFEENNGYTKINSNSKGETSIIGLPKLPQFSTLLKLDPFKEYDISYSVENSYIIEDIDIIPNQRIDLNGLEKSSIENKDNSFYSSSENYPYENITLSDPMVMRDLVLSNVTIVPFQYNPKNRQLEIYQTVEIHVYEVGEASDIRRRSMPSSRVFENIYKNSIINYNTNSRDDYQQPAVLYIGPSSAIGNATFEQLIEWRKQRGYVVYTATTSGNSTSSIKNIIEDAYDNFNPPPEYVTLIGDVGGSYSIPTYYEDFGHDSYGNQCEGDHPYSQIDGNDLLPEVLLGRMSIRSSSELTTVVYKILNYEKATYLDTYEEYYERAAMAGDPSTSGNSCAITKEAVRQSLQNHGFDDVNIKTSGNGWATWMENELEDGVLFFNYRGYLGMSGFSTSNVDNASSGWKLPFATVLTCGTGSFAEDQTAMSEKFFRAGSVTNPRGGVAAIGTATWNTHTLFNNIVDLGIYNGLLADDVETAGAALVSGKLSLYNTYPGDPYQWISAFTQWNNLMGDAATHLYTDTPEILSVTYSHGSNYLDVEVVDSRGNPVSDAQVTALTSGYQSGLNLFTDELGQVTFSNWVLDNNESAVLTVTKLDHKPYQTSFNFDDSIGLVGEIIINDDNDSIAYAGETLGLSIPIGNYGSQTATNITATLTSTSNNVVISNATVTYPNVSNNSVVYPDDDFIISILPSTQQYEDLGLRLTVFDGGSNQWESEIPLDVMGSLLSIQGAGFFQSGQTSNFNITLANTGMLTATNVTGQLEYNGNQIEVNDANGSWGSLTSGQSSSSSNGFNITLSNDIVSGTQFILQLLLESSEGYSSVENYLITVGTVSESDPMGPDQYGYYIYDSSDTDYDLVPVYDWIDITSNGTNLNLSNSGDGNWSGSGPLGYVDLPFTFKFYGIEYDQITVCTNGWISPGYSGSAAFRNYPIPGAGGPTPMIAAFWDDLTTGNNGDVYVYSTNQYVIIQWENMRTDWGNDNNTFQMIIYNDSAQPNGDNSIKIQYQDFNNTSSGSFTAYPPIHGSYATIGIENHLSDDGLQYSYYNNYDRAAMELGDQTALYITTQAPITLPAPQLNYNISYTEFEIPEGNSDYSMLTIENNGEEGSLLSYSVSKNYPELESPFNNSGGGPDSYGYFWADSDISNDVDYEWEDISSDGTQVNFTSNDASTESIDIGFDFPFYGDMYSSFIINANGWIGFGEDNSEWYNGNIPSQDYPKPAIFGFWDDLNPVNDNCNSTCAGNVYYHSSDERLVVWFDNVAHWVSEGFENTSYDFQIIIYSSGEIDINIRTIEGNYSATVGIQNASGTIASQVDTYNGNYFNNNMSIKFKKPFIPSDWLILSAEDGGSLYGDLYDGQSDQINIEIDTESLIQDVYDASIIISSNGMSDIEIPIVLNVISDTGLLGDMNGDLSINIQDVVILVGIILDSDDFLVNGDLNQDGLIDVIDIVQLVGLILGE
tara:strand:- start:797 stop:5329 length:4533 start_codon:yes stop_codon:yes gene_type:complete